MPAMNGMALRRLPAVRCALAVIFVASPAAGAVLRSFDQVFQGDDPSEVFEFDLPFDPAVRSVLRFDGFAENLGTGPEAETGVRFQIRWRPAVGDGGGADFPDDPEGMGVRLPAADPVLGPTRVPIRFETGVPYSPAVVLLGVEGLGPSDHFRFVGEFSIRPVPEPTGVVSLAVMAIASIGFGRPRRTTRRGR